MANLVVHFEIIGMHAVVLRAYYIICLAGTLTLIHWWHQKFRMSESMASSLMPCRMMGRGFLAALLGQRFHGAQFILCGRTGCRGRPAKSRIARRQTNTRADQ